MMASGPPERWKWPQPPASTSRKRRSTHHSRPAAKPKPRDARSECSIQSRNSCMPGFPSFVPHRDRRLGELGDRRQQRDAEAIDLRGDVLLAALDAADVFGQVVDVVPEIVPAHVVALHLVDLLV